MGIREKGRSGLRDGGNTPETQVELCILSRVVGSGEWWELLGRAVECRLRGLKGHGKGFGICPKGSASPWRMLSRQ